MHICDIQFEVFGATDGSVIEKADLLNPNRIIKLNVDSDEYVIQKPFLLRLFSL